MYMEACNYWLIENFTYLYACLFYLIRNLILIASHSSQIFMTQAMGNLVKNEDVKKNNVWRLHNTLEGLYKG